MDLCRDETQVGQLGRLAIVTKLRLLVDGFKEQEVRKHSAGGPLARGFSPEIPDEPIEALIGVPIVI
jgi:hypothetical protein